ncbi:Retron-type reverse transcriptase, partial [Pseudomonas syringae pv. actinidiae ICMP 19073]|uniref:group II intron maturase-specific domain-containing protein n=1 Tax=Pseudomonas syringae TaxID=317 RepID=UPI0003571B5D
GYLIDEEGNNHLSGRTVKRYRKRVRECWSARQGLTSRGLVEQWRKYLFGWFGYFRLAVESDFTVLSQWTRRHMRKCFWQRWQVSFHDGAWKAARHPAMHQALSNQCLRRYGLVTAQDLASAQR